MIETLLIPVTMFAIGSSGVVMSLFLATFLRNKFTNISTFIISMLTYVAFVFIGLSIWLSERVEWINADEGDVVRLIIRLLIGFGGALGIRYFLLPPNEYNNKNLWVYIVIGLLVMSSLFFFFPLEIRHDK